MITSSFGYFIVTLFIIIAKSLCKKLYFASMLNFLAFLGIQCKYRIIKGVGLRGRYIRKLNNSNTSGRF